MKNVIKTKFEKVRKMKKNKSIIVLLLILFFTIIIYSTQFSLFDNNTNNVSYDLLLKSNGFYNLTGSPIYIDDTDPNYNWSKTVVDNEWCTGSGTPLDPYIIEDIYINRTGIDTPSITIKNSKSYFIIRNCTIYRSYGIYLKNVSHGNLIENYLWRLYDIFSVGVGGDILSENCSDINFINNNIGLVWIMFFNSIGCTLENNTIVNTLTYLYESNYMSIVNNDLSGTSRLFMGLSNNNLISGNSFVISNAASDHKCMELGGYGNSVINNNITVLDGAGYGISGPYYPTNIIDNNRLYGCGFSNVGGPYSTFGTNYVNDKYFYYYVNETTLDDTDFINAGQIILKNCNDSVIQNQDLTNVSIGASLYNCNDIMINANNLSYNHYSGVYMDDCKNITIKSNNASYCAAGFSIWYTSLSNIIENNISHTNVGINLRGDNNTLYKNKIFYNQYGIRSHYNYFNNIIENEFLYNEHAISGTFISGFNITANIIRDNNEGVYASGNSGVDDKNYFTYNTIEYNSHFGLEIYTTNDTAEIFGNTIRYNKYGMKVRNTHNSIIKNNTLLNNQIGLLFSSDDNVITDNIFINNSEYGMFLEIRNWWGIPGNPKETNCKNNIITFNSFYGCGLGISEQDKDLMTVLNVIDETNMVNGKPLRFYVNETGVGSVIDVSGSGQIVLINCTTVYLGEVEVSNSSIGIVMSYCDDGSIWKLNSTNNKLHGIYMYKCNNVSISNSIIKYNNEDGIHVRHGTNIIINENTIESNNEGIHLYRSSNNIIKSNEFVNNYDAGLNITPVSQNNDVYINNFNNPYNINAVDDGGNNHWNNGSVGNEWHDYDGFDCDGDGIGETPYISGNIFDEFPICNTLDTFPPLISVHSPYHLQEFGEVSPTLNITIDEYILLSYWVILEGEIQNFSGDVSEVYIKIDETTWDNLVDGEYLLEVYARDLAGNIGYNEVVVEKVKNGEPVIFGYNVILIISLIGLITAIILKRKFN